MFTKRISNAMHKQAARKFSKFLRRSISALPGKWLQERSIISNVPAGSIGCAVVLKVTYQQSDGGYHDVLRIYNS